MREPTEENVAAAQCIVGVAKAVLSGVHLGSEIGAVAHDPGEADVLLTLMQGNQAVTARQGRVRP